MINYLYTDYADKPLTQRFSIDNNYPSNGLEEWKKYISCLLDNNYSNIKSEFEDLKLVKKISEEEKTLLLLLKKLKEEYQPLPHSICPRLFISHRQVDENFALRIAKLAANNGFYYWLDVLDPQLNNLGQLNITEPLKTLLTACIIETALINFTHVIACLTPQTRGSMWVPYEYGRITDIPHTFTKAAAWPHPALQVSDFPEYMHLGEKAETEQDIKKWLIKERREFQNCGKQTILPPAIADIPKLPNVNKYKP